jgi:hypothetical protein
MVAVGVYVRPRIVESPDSRAVRESRTVSTFLVTFLALLAAPAPVYQASDDSKATTASAAG